MMKLRKYNYVYVNKINHFAGPDCGVNIGKVENPCVQTNANITQLCLRHLDYQLLQLGTVECICLSRKPRKYNKSITQKIRQ